MAADTKKVQKLCSWVCQQLKSPSGIASRAAFNKQFDGTPTATLNDD